MERYVEKRNRGIRWIFFGLFILLFAADAYFVFSGSAVSFDELVQGTVFDLRSDFLNTIMIGITHLGDTKVVAGICILLIILPNRMKLGLPVAFATGFGSCCHYAIKLFVERARPDEAMWLVPEDGFSFPSGHSNAGLIFYLFLAVLLGRYLVMSNSKLGAFLLRLLLVMLVLMIGVSRIYVGVHYPTDVLGGWLLGASLLIIFITIYDNIWPQKFRVSYAAPQWAVIPPDAEKRKGWKKPNKKHATGEMISFPKKRSAWKIPNTHKKEALNKDVAAKSDDNETL